MQGNRGFTVIELMVTVVVLSVLLTLAAPSYRALVLDSRMTAQANEFLTALSLTRSEAVKRNAIVTLSAKAGVWSNGWVITDVGGTVLRDHPALEGASTLANNGGPTSIPFRSNGQPLTGATRFRLCNPAISAPGREIEVGVSGRARINKLETCG